MSDRPEWMPAEGPMPKQLDENVRKHLEADRDCFKRVIGRLESGSKYYTAVHGSVDLLERALELQHFIDVEVKSKGEAESQLSSDLSRMTLTATTLRNGGGVGHEQVRLDEQVKRIENLLRRFAELVH